MTPELLGQLIDQYGPALTLYARQWCAAPEDVVQEAFVKLTLQKELPNQIVAWLYRVVRNGAISQARAARRRQKYESALAELTQNWFMPSEDPAGMDAQVVTDALQDIPLEQREVIIAHLWGELTFEQIAELIGTSAATAYRRYVAGLAVLRQILRVPCPTRN